MHPNLVATLTKKSYIICRGQQQNINIFFWVASGGMESLTELAPSYASMFQKEL
jgi:hypothetical protein